MPRELLKLRKGDCAIKIRKDGSVELAGLQDQPLIDEGGLISPVVLFAAAWARKNQDLYDKLVNNFKDCVRDGYFGPDAKEEFKQAEEKVKEHNENKKQKSEKLTFLVPEEKVKEHNEKQKVGKLTIDEGVENETK